MKAYYPVTKTRRSYKLIVSAFSPFVISGGESRDTNIMSNMSYCRFENTFRDLQDCEENLFEKLDGRENRYREHLIKLAHSIAKSVPLKEIELLPFGDEDEDEDEE